MSERLGPIVAKFGGSSMARPDIVMAQLAACESQGENPFVVVVSAPAKYGLQQRKVTDMLFGYKRRLTNAPTIQRPFENFLVVAKAQNNERCREIVRGIPDDLTEWSDNGDPVEALGEHWTAQLMAIITGRTFVDSREVIKFDMDNEWDEVATAPALQARCRVGGQYLMAGYFGGRPDGRVAVFPRNGSDITAAIVTRVLGAHRHDNWVDVPGFMTADPRVDPNAELLERISYETAHAMDLAGSAPLHHVVSEILEPVGIPTLMRNTHGELGNRGTEIVPSRVLQAA